MTPRSDHDSDRTAVNDEPRIESHGVDPRKDEAEGATGGFAGDLGNKTTSTA